MRARSGLRRIVLLVTTVMAGLTAATAPAKEADKSERLQAIAQAYQANDCKRTVDLAAPLVESSKAGLSEQEEADVLELLTGCEADLKMEEAAYAHALRATRFELSSDYVWHVRLAAEARTQRLEAAVATVEAMTQGRGAALNSIPVSWMWRIDGDLTKTGRVDLRRRLLAVLASDAYAPDEYYEPPDSFRATYARLLVQDGEKEAARALVERITTQYALAHAMLDPALRGFVPTTADHRVAAERSLEQYREAMARYPDRLRPLHEVASALRYLGRAEEGLKLLQSVTTRVEAPDGFEDRGKMINWYWDEVARAHAALGHYEEAAAAFRNGARASEDGTPNVSQVINLAGMQIDYGRPEEALNTLKAFDDGRSASPFGFMEMRLGRGCAHAAAGHAREAAADLDYMRSHEADNPGALTRMLLCLGDMDGAAASIIRRLADPDQRVDALAELSDYDDPPFTPPADPITPKLAALKARAEVKAAIDRAGGTRRFHVQRGEF